MNKYVKNVILSLYAQDNGTLNDTAWNAYDEIYEETS